MQTWNSHSSHFHSDHFLISVNKMYTISLFCNPFHTFSYRNSRFRKVTDNHYWIKFCFCFVFLAIPKFSIRMKYITWWIILSIISPKQYTIYWWSTAKLLSYVRSLDCHFYTWKNTWLETRMGNTGGSFPLLS